MVMVLTFWILLELLSLAAYLAAFLQTRPALWSALALAGFTLTLWEATYEWPNPTLRIFGFAFFLLVDATVAVILGWLISWLIERHSFWLWQHIGSGKYLSSKS